jgi:hypothetical protein
MTLKTNIIVKIDRMAAIVALKNLHGVLAKKLYLFRKMND